MILGNSGAGAIHLGPVFVRRRAGLAVVVRGSVLIRESTVGSSSVEIMDSLIYGSIVRVNSAVPLESFISRGASSVIRRHRESVISIIRRPG